MARIEANATSIWPPRLESSQTAGFTPCDALKDVIFIKRSPQLSVLTRNLRVKGNSQCFDYASLFTQAAFGVKYSTNSIYSHCEIKLGRQMYIHTTK